MTTTIVTTQAPVSDDEQSYREMLNKAEKLFASLTKQEGKARAKMEEASAEISRIEEHRTRRDDQLLTVRGIVAKMRRAETDAQNFANLATGGTREAEAMTRLKEIKAELEINQ